MFMIYDWKTWSVVHVKHPDGSYFISAQVNMLMSFTAAADQLTSQRPTSPPQEERKDWKIIVIGLTAAALFALIVCTLLCVMLRKVPNFCTAVKFHELSGTKSLNQDTSCLWRLLDLVDTNSVNELVLICCFHTLFNLPHSHKFTKTFFVCFSMQVIFV